MREPESQVPKYQKLTAVLYDEDYGGDDEVIQHFRISLVPSDNMDACGCDQLWSGSPRQLPYITAVMSVRQCCVTAMTRIQCAHWILASSSNKPLLRGAQLHSDAQMSRTAGVQMLRRRLFGSPLPLCSISSLVGVHV